MAETGYTSYADQGTGAHLLQTGKDTPLVKDVVGAVQDINKGDIGAVAGDVSSFASDAAGVLADPLNALISDGLGFLMDMITPLRDELEKVTGDHAALDKGKEAFADIGKDLGKLTTELQDITTKGFQGWTGSAKDAASARVGTFVQGVQGTVNNAEDISQLLGVSATLMEAAYNLVMGIIADLIEWLIVTWLAALAAEVPTLGGSTVAAGAATAAEVGVEGANAAEKVQQATSLVEKITNIFKKIMAALKKLKDAQKLLKEGKDAKGIKDVKSAADAAKDAKKAKKAENAAKAGDDAAKKQSLLDKAKNYGQEKLQGKKDELWNHPKEDLNNLAHNPLGRLQSMAHDRTGNLGHQVVGKLKETGIDVGKKVFPLLSGDLLDQVAPGSDPVAQARQAGPDGWLDPTRTNQDLQG